MNDKYIMCILGNDRHKFRRLVELSARVAEATNKSLIVQAGHNKYDLKNGEQFAFSEKNVFMELINKSCYVVSHCGSGSLRRILRSEKKSIILPRLRKYDEHIDDHQIQIAEEYSKYRRCYLPDDYCQIEINLNKCLGALENYEYNFDEAFEHDLSIEIAKVVESWL